MLDKYRHESKQTLCIIGVLVLSAKLCKADGHFSEQEEEEILKIVPHEPGQRKLLMRLMEEASADSKSIEHYALRLKKLIGDENKDFLEFIVAVLVKLAHVNHVYSEEEDRDIKKVAEIFQLEESFFKKISETTMIFFNFFKGKKDE